MEITTEKIETGTLGIRLLREQSGRTRCRREGGNRRATTLCSAGLEAVGKEGGRRVGEVAARRRQLGGRAHRCKRGWFRRLVTASSDGDALVDEA